MTSILGKSLSFEFTLVFGLILSFIILIIISFVVLYVLNIRRNMGRLSEIQKWMERIQEENYFEDKLAIVLEAISHEINAPTYALYVWEERFNKFIIRSSRLRSQEYPSSDSKHLGALASSQDVYTPSPIASELFFTDRVEVITEGEVPLLVIPVSKKSMIRIGPVKDMKRPSRNFKKWLAFIKPMLDEVIEAEQVKEQSKVTVSSKNALDKIAKIALEKHYVFEVVLPFCVNALKADGGCLIKVENNFHAIKEVAGLHQELAENLAYQNDSLREICNMAATKDVFYLNKYADDFYPFPNLLTEADMSHLFILKLDDADQYYYFIWFRRMIEQELVLAYLQTLSENVGRFTKIQADYLKGMGTFILLLQTIVRLLDCMSPYSVGYSELMSRYSVVIAKQLGLSDDIIRDVALAAYLSHLGTFALSSDLFQKEGQYTENEFELMKLHAEISALIVTFSTGNKRAASYIRHHHERMDGHGYPAGLMDEEIPIGAKIIAVSQTFLAKINGRNYRYPIIFDQALEAVLSARGKQLDPDVVNTFIHWFRDKRIENVRSGRALGACYEMCCVPEKICRSCPAYRKTEMNCWEIEGVFCKAHGKSCETCFVKTEFDSR